MAIMIYLLKEYANEKIDVAIIEALTETLNKSIKQYMASLGSDSENTNLFKMNFIKKFSDDVIFLNDLSGNADFYHRYGYLIMRNMLEQLIEFLYVKKNPHLVDEYLGLKIDLNALQTKHSPVEGEHAFGKKRYLKNRHFRAFRRSKNKSCCKYSVLYNFTNYRTFIRRNR